MRIFSNFNTRFVDKVLEDKYETFKKTDVFVIYRSKFYLLLYILPHMIGYFSILIFTFIIFANLSFHPAIYICFFILWLLIFWFRIWHKFLKYLCDFTVVTPWWITTYTQKGILHSTLKEIPSKRIKAIEVSRTNILWNIFGYGYIDIVADLNEFVRSNEDYSDEAPWVVWLTYVDNPHKIKARISKICFK